MGENPHSQNQLLNQYISKLEIRFILIDNAYVPICQEKNILYERLFLFDIRLSR